MVWIIILFVLGLLLIIKGGDWFVDAASWLAEISGIPPVIIGATIVSLATTMPELLVSVLASLQGKVAMAVGNAVGSVNANIGLIMAMSIIWSPVIFRRKELSLKALMMLAACFLLWLFSLRGVLSLTGSLVMLLFFVGFILENIHTAKSSVNSRSLQRVPRKRTIINNVLKFLVGAAAIVVGAQLLVDNGSALALHLGVSEDVIGVTIIAIGTSLPELVTAVTALIKKQAELSIGNIIGANIIDLTMILPVCALVSGGTLPVSRQSVILDMPVALLMISLAIMPPLFSGRFRQSQGLLMLLLYLAYILVIATGYVLIFL